MNWKRAWKKSLTKYWQLYLLLIPVARPVARHRRVGEAAVAPRLVRRIRRVVVGQSLEPSHIVAQLQKVTVAISAAHHLNVTGILRVRTVHKHDRTVRAVLSPPASGDPFVPARDQHDVGFRLMRAIPLLLKVVPFLPRTGSGIVLAVVERPPTVALLAVHRAVAEPARLVLRDRDVHHALRDLLALEHALQAREVHPRPAALLGRLVRPLRLDDREKRLRLFVAFLLLGDDHRFPVQLIPDVACIARPVHRVVDSPHRLAGSRVRIEHDLRDLPSGVMVLLKDAHHELRVLLVDRRVRCVEEQEVYSRLHNELHVAAHDPFVVGEVVAVERLAPVVVRAPRPPHRPVRLLPCVRVRRENLRHVPRPPTSVFAEPQKVKQPHLPFAFRGRGEAGKCADKKARNYRFHFHI